MKCRLSLLVITLLGLSVFSPIVAGPGGGHGGGGHSGSHFGGGSSSGHSFGHSVGHSLGHIFGHHSGGRGTHPKENPAGRVNNPAHLPPFAFAQVRTRRRMFHRNPFFSSGYCDSPRFTWRDSLFPGEFNCFSGSFVFDPFFYGAAWDTYFWSDSLIDSEDFANAVGPSEAADNEMSTSVMEPGAAVPLPSNAEKPIALLQLRDGSMYGLTRYWLEGTTLHYVTTYGGENSVALDRVDFTRTQQLNAELGMRFDLTKNPHNP